MDRYFGEPWPSGICDEKTQAPTPVGENCWWCETKIRDGDQGIWNLFREKSDDTVLEPIHKECLVRVVNGSPAHLRGACSCYGGSEPHKIPETPEEKRKEALETWAALFSAGR